jgi:hypothetical protein
MYGIQELPDLSQQQILPLCWNEFGKGLVSSQGVFEREKSLNA